MSNATKYDMDPVMADLIDEAKAEIVSLIAEDLKAEVKEEMEATAKYIDNAHSRDQQNAWTQRFYAVLDLWVSTLKVNPHVKHDAAEVVAFQVSSFARKTRYAMEY